jgi:hypothetical protein
MNNTLVTELRSISATVLSATSAAEQGDWRVAERGTSDVSTRAHRVLRQLTSTSQELDGHGEARARKTRHFDEEQSRSDHV